MKGPLLAFGLIGVFMVGCASTMPSPEPAMAPTNVASVTQITNADLAPPTPTKRPKLDWTDPYDGTQIQHEVRELDTSDPWDNGSSIPSNASLQQAAAPKQK